MSIILQNRVKLNTLIFVQSGCTIINLSEVKFVYLDTNADDIIVARLIRKLRRDKDISQAQLATALGLIQNNVSRIELGTRKVTLGELREICEILCIRLSDFVQEYEAQLSHYGKTN